MRMRYRSTSVIVFGRPSSYQRWSSDAPGCVATGATVETRIADMRRALTLHEASMREDGEAIPEPTGPAVYVEHISSPPTGPESGDFDAHLTALEPSDAEVHDGDPNAKTTLTGRTTSDGDDKQPT
jgi:predicted RNase H-like HicB family nuclease